MRFSRLSVILVLVIFFTGMTGNPRKGEKPEGKIAFSGADSTGYFLGLVNADGTNFSRIAQGAEPVVPKPGNVIYFSRFGRAATELEQMAMDWNLIAIDLQGNLIKDYGTARSYSFDITAGQQMVYIDEAITPPGFPRQWGINVQDLKTMKTRTITKPGPDAVWIPSEPDFHIVRWSPSGDRVAFSARFSIEESIQIYVMNVDGSSLQQITHTKQGAVDPAWAPDGESIAYVSYDDGQIHIINVNGGRDLVVTKGRHRAFDLKRPFFSPEGEWIVFCKNTRDYWLNRHIDTFKLYLVKVDGTRQRPLMRQRENGAGDINPYWFLPAVDRQELWPCSILIRLIWPGAMGLDHGT